MCVCGLCQFWGGYSPTSDLDLGKKVGNLDFGGGYSPTSDLDLGKKVGNLDFFWGGVFSNFGFGLRKKSWIFGFLDLGGGYSPTSDLDLGRNLDFGGGGILKLSWRIGVFCRIWTKFSPTGAGICLSVYFRGPCHLYQEERDLES